MDKYKRLEKGLKKFMKTPEGKIIYEKWIEELKKKMDKKDVVVICGNQV